MKPLRISRGWKAPLDGWPFPVRSHRAGLDALCVMMAAMAGAVPRLGADVPPVLVTQWSSTGTGNGQFDGPLGVAVDPAGNVYVADSKNNRVQKFANDGSYLTKWPVPRIVTPGVAVDASSNVYIVDGYNGRIYKYDSNGAYLTEFGSLGTGPGQLDRPQGVAVDQFGSIYVADMAYTENKDYPGLFRSARVQKLTASGVFIRQWVPPPPGNQGGSPLFPAVDKFGNVFITDSVLNRVVKFTDQGVYVQQWGSEGPGDGQFRTPSGIAVDSFGNVYVADTGQSRVQKFSGDGVYLSKWGWPDRVFATHPEGIAVDTLGNVFVTDGDRVLKFSPSISYGDSNLDRSFDQADVDRVVDSILGRAPLTPGTRAFTQSDVSGDGSVTMQDLNLLVDCLLHRIDKFPVEATPNSFCLAADGPLPNAAKINNSAAMTKPLLTQGGNPFTLTAAFRNTGQSTYVNPYFKVITLRGPGCPCAVQGFGGEGSAIPIDVGDRLWSPGEEFTHTFRIQLTQMQPFSFFADIMGNKIGP